MHQFNHLVSPAKGVIAKPAVWHFDFPGYPIESGWGWIRASDLLVALNFNRFKAGESPLTANGVTREYPEVFTKQTSLTTVSHSGHLGGGGSPAEWFDDCVQHDTYIPGRIGTDLLRLARAK